MARVVRCHLRSPEESLTFWREHAPFRYAVEGYYDEKLCTNLLLDSDEWIFADDLEALVRELVQWEARNLHAEWVVPTEEEYNDPVFGELVIAAWVIIDLPETLDDFTMGLSNDLPILRNPFATPAKVEAAFLDWFARNLDWYDGVVLFDFSKDSFEAYILDEEEDVRPPQDDPPALAYAASGNCWPPYILGKEIPSPLWLCALLSPTMPPCPFPLSGSYRARGG